MSDPWLVWNSGANSPALNMAWDATLLSNSPARKVPLVRFYSWTEEAATFGYFQHYAEIETITALRPLIRRPTGGGLVPHDRDWTYSLSIPPVHSWYQLDARESYQKVHAWVQLAFRRMGIETELAPCCKKEIPGQCFIGHEQFDLLWHGRKIAGAAQRRNRDGLLIQGSVQPPPLGLNRAQWEEALLQSGSDNWGHTWSIFEPSPSLSDHAMSLAKNSFDADSFNRRR